jgi:hypothetical protein
MIAIILMSWTIWKAKNEAIFNNSLMSTQECKRAFSMELAKVLCRIKTSLRLFLINGVKIYNRLLLSSNFLHLLFCFLTQQPPLSAPVSLVSCNFGTFSINKFLQGRKSLQFNQKTKYHSSTFLLPHLLLLPLPSVAALPCPHSSTIPPLFYFSR